MCECQEGLGVRGIVCYHAGMRRHSLVAPRQLFGL